MGFGCAPPPWGVRLAVLQRFPLLGKPLELQSPAAKRVRNREMNQLFHSRIEKRNGKDEGGEEQMAFFAFL